MRSSPSERRKLEHSVTVNPIADILTDHPLVILDGALATELEGRGCDLNDPLWSAKVLLEDPARIGAVHADYYAAGADGVITATYQASVEGFARRGLDRAAALALMGRAVTLAAEVRDAFWAVPENRPGRPRPFVAASIGPYGAYLADGSEYRGDYGLSEAQLMDFHRPRMAAVVAAGADILACETIPCMVEARALVRLLSEFPDTHAWFSFSAKDGGGIHHGERIADCAAILDGYPQVAAVGVNCTAPQFVPELIGNIQQHTQKPVIVYPNSGEVYEVGTRTWQGDPTPDAFARMARAWHRCGAQLIGGCCRTTPADIAAIARWARA
jgi:homocysteine S-methyltransferase